MKRIILTAGILTLILVIGSGTALAGQLAKGESEVSAGFIFSDSSSGDDDLQTIDLSLGWGRMLTDAHEVGGFLGYQKADDGDFSLDGGSLGAFYNYNFAAGTNMNPYLGVNVSTFFGDLFEAANFGYGVEAGIKVWPWDNGGFNFGIGWESIDTDFDSTVDTLSAFMGIRLKY